MLPESSQLRGTSERTVRRARPADLPALYDICVRTADAGADARGHYTSDALMGDLFAAPYAIVEPDLTFVLDDGPGTAVAARKFYDRVGFTELTVADAGDITYLGRSTQV